MRDVYEDCVEGFESLVRRRHELCKDSPNCPLCGSEQVQLTEWPDTPEGSWKYRICKERW